MDRNNTASHSRVGFCKENKITIFVFFALFVISLIPIFTIKTLPLWDYPNHIARLHILTHIDTDPYLAQFYSVNWNFLPNLAFDIISLPFAYLFGADIAGRIFIAIIFFMISTGVLVLNYALFRKISPYVLLVFPFLYNQIFLMAFLSYLFSIGFCLWVMAFWIMLREKRVWIRLVVFSVLSLLLLVSHLYGFAFYGLVVFSYELGKYLKDRKMPRSLNNLYISIAQFIPSVLLFFLVSPTAEGVRSASRFDLLGRLTSWSYIIEFYNPLAQLIVASIIFAAGIYFLGRKHIIFAKDMIAPFIFLLVIFLSLPEGFFGSSFVAMRFSIVFFFFLLSCITIPKIIRISRQTVIFIAILAIVFQGIFIQYKWQSFQPFYDDFAQAIEKMEKGSTVTSVIVYPGRWHKLLEPPLMHTVCFTVINKSCFVSTIFAKKWQQPIIVKPKYAHLIQDCPDIKGESRDRKMFYLKKINKKKGQIKRASLKDYDYIFIIDKGFEPGNEFKKIFISQRFTLYQNKRSVL